MKKYYVTNTRTTQRNKRVMFEGGAENIQYDYTSWAEDNGDTTSVTVTVEYGDAAISGESLTSNVKSMLVTTSNTGKSLIKLVATDGTDKDVQWLEIYAKPMNVTINEDYGVVSA